MTQPSIRSLLWSALLPIGVWVYLSSRNIGHLLLWDEAMQLCTLRSFLGGGDYFSHWFWRHPPLMSLLMYLCGPYRPGFDIRVEWLVIMLGAINILLLYLLNARTFGIRTGFWSSMAYAALPGLTLLGVWIKIDPLAVTFGLMGLLLLQSNRIIFCAVSLGLSLLSKETGIFFMGAACLTLLFNTSPIRCVKNLLCLILVPLPMIAWWYLGFSSALPHNDGSGATHITLPHLQFAFTQREWAAPWWQYIAELPALLGAFGGVLAVVGICLVIQHSQTRRAPTSRDYRSDLPAAAVAQPNHLRLELWPLCLLLPSYVILSLLTNKVSWIVICLLPAWATLIGLALNWMEASPAFPIRLRRFQRTLPWLCFAILATTTWCAAYDAQLQKLVPGQWQGATRSREVAAQLDRIATPGDRILMTSFYYWEGLTPASPCAVFTYYSQAATTCDFLMRDCRSTFSNLQNDVIENDISIAVLSPPPGQAEQAVFEGFTKLYGQPIPCEGAFIFPIKQITSRSTP